ncbi:MAG: hypothetical protein Q8N18_13320 [Opitutaceae bacterium]|nr:hypothetical protein [Opitutaceae bacterium]
MRPEVALQSMNLLHSAVWLGFVRCLGGNFDLRVARLSTEGNTPCHSRVGPRRLAVAMFLAVVIILIVGATLALDRVRAEARGRMIGAATGSMPWEGRVWNYARREGMSVSLEGEVAWIHPAGPKPYWRGRMSKVTYDFAP